MGSQEHSETNDIMLCFWIVVLKLIPQKIAVKPTMPPNSIS